MAFKQTKLSVTEIRNLAYNFGADLVPVTDTGHKMPLLKNNEWRDVRYIPDDWVSSKTGEVRGVGIRFHGGTYWADFDLDSPEAMECAGEILPANGLWVTKTYLSDYEKRNAKKGDVFRTHCLLRIDKKDASWRGWYDKTRWTTKTGSTKDDRELTDLRGGGSMSNHFSHIHGFTGNGDWLELTPPDGKEIVDMKPEDVAIFTPEELIDLWAELSEACGAKYTPQYASLPKQYSFSEARPAKKSDSYKSHANVVKEWLENIPADKALVVWQKAFGDQAKLGAKMKCVWHPDGKNPNLHLYKDDGNSGAFCWSEERTYGIISAAAYAISKDPEESANPRGELFADAVKLIEELTETECPKPKKKTSKKEHILEEIVETAKDFADTHIWLWGNWYVERDGRWVLKNPETIEEALKIVHGDILGTNDINYLVREAKMKCAPPANDWEVVKKENSILPCNINTGAKLRDNVRAWKNCELEITASGEFDIKPRNREHFFPFEIGRDLPDLSETIDIKQAEKFYDFLESRFGLQTDEVTEEDFASLVTRMGIFLGSCFSDARFEYLWVHIGEGGKGKDTINNIIFVLLGLHLVRAHHSLKDLINDKFAASEDCNKMVVYYSELPGIPKTTAAKAERDAQMRHVKGCVGRSFQRRRLMHQSDVGVFRPSAVYHASANVATQIADEGEGKNTWNRRLMFLPVSNFFPPGFKKNTELFNEIAEEEGDLVIAWGLQQYANYIKTNEMPTTERIEKILYEAVTDSLSEMVGMMIHDPDGRVYYDEIKAVYASCLGQDKINQGQLRGAISQIMMNAEGARRGGPDRNKRRYIDGISWTRDISVFMPEEFEQTLPAYTQPSEDDVEAEIENYMVQQSKIVGEEDPW